MEEKKTVKMNSIDDVGQVQIADDVIAIISEIATTEVNGVAGMGGTLSHEIVQSLTKKRTPKGVKVEVDGKQVMLKITLIINYGHKIPKVTKKVQQSVKTSIETMTGLDVVAVDINVTGVYFDKPIIKEKPKKQKTKKSN